MNSTIQLDAHLEIRDAVQKMCSDFSPEYWRKCDDEGRFPQEFFDTTRSDGWLGIAIPEEYGGAGLGISAAATLLSSVGECGGGWTATGAIQPYVYAPHALIRHGTDRQKREILPLLVNGEKRMCFAITEPNTGIDTTRVMTKAERQGETYVLNGEKTWITGAHLSEYIMILVRTSPVTDTRRPIDGLSLFCTKLNRNYVEIVPIKKHGANSLPSSQLFIRDFPVPAGDLVGEEGRGFRYLLDSINPERILLAASAVGLGRLAINRASQYAKERIVFNRPIGQNQSIQHPLARAWVELEAASLMVAKAAALFDAKMDCATEANAAKFLAAEAAHKACYQAMVTHGGYGYAREYDIERLLRESMLPVLTPVGQNLVLSYIGERILGLPKSY